MSNYREYMNKIESGRALIHQINNQIDTIKKAFNGYYIWSVRNELPTKFEVPNKDTLRRLAEEMQYLEKQLNDEYMIALDRHAQRRANAKK